MIIDPKKILENEAIIPASGTKCQQCGVDVTVKENVVVEPHGFKNIEIAEKVHVPENAAGFLFVRSSLSRKGIFISSGVYDPGFSGAAGASYRPSVNTCTCRFQRSSPRKVRSSASCSSTRSAHPSRVQAAQAPV